MSAARNERGSVRGLLLLALIASGAALAWVASRALAPHPAAPGLDAGASGAGGPANGAASKPGAAGRSSSGRSAVAGGEPDPDAKDKASVPAAPAPAWAECLDRDDPDRVRECLRSMLGDHPDPSQVAQVLCTDPRTTNAQEVRVQGEAVARTRNAWILVTEALARVSPAEALDWIDKVNLGCKRYQEHDLFRDCLAARRDQDPAWFREFRATLIPERLFDPAAGEAGIQVTTLFLEQKDPEVLAWVEAGSRGELGGTTDQIDRAIGISLAFEQAGTVRFDHLRSVIASARVPGKGATGSTLVHALLDPNSWPEGQPRPALDALLSLLYDERFQESAAATMCLSFTAEAPAGCDPASWSAIRARGFEIANQIGLVMPGVQR